MRGLYLVFTIFNCIQTYTHAMQAPAIATVSNQAKAKIPFHEALGRIGKEAEAKRLAQAHEKARADKDTVRVLVPDPLIKLGQDHASSIKAVFNAMLQGNNHKGISDLILDYISNSYIHYQDLFYWEQDAHGAMKAFYPCVRLTFNEDGTHIHAQLNTSNVSSNHQLVGWSLYSKVTRSDQIKDYDLGPKESRKKLLNNVVYTRFMWWQAYIKNIFNNNGDFAPASTLKVVLQYSVAQMIKAALIAD